MPRDCVNSSNFRRLEIIPKPINSLSFTPPRRVIAKPPLGIARSPKPTVNVKKKNKKKKKKIKAKGRKRAIPRPKAQKQLPRSSQKAAADKIVSKPVVRTYNIATQYEYQLKIPSEVEESDDSVFIASLRAAMKSGRSSAKIETDILNVVNALIENKNKMLATAIREKNEMKKCMQAKINKKSKEIKLMKGDLSSEWDKVIKDIENSLKRVLRNHISPADKKVEAESVRYKIQKLTMDRKGMIRKNEKEKKELQACQKMTKEYESELEEVKEQVKQYKDLFERTNFEIDSIVNLTEDYENLKKEMKILESKHLQKMTLNTHLIRTYEKKLRDIQFEQMLQCE